MKKARAKPPKEPTAPPRRSPGVGILAGWSIVWLTAAVVEVLLMFVMARDAVHDRDFSLAERLRLIAFDLRALLIAVLLLGFPVSLVAWRVMPKLVHRRGERWAGSILLSLLACALLLLWAASWSTFWGAGGFLDRDTITFWLTQPLQVFHWVPGIFWIVPPLVCLVGLIATLALVRLIPRLRRRAAWSIFAAALASAITCAIIGSIGDSHDTRAVFTPGEELLGSPKTIAQQYREARAYRTGPFARAMSDIGGLFADDTSQLRPSPNIPIINRPIIPMVQYVAGVDRARVKHWNVIVIVVESLRDNVLRAYGGTREVMPTCDALAAEGRVFLNAYAQATHSNYASPCPLSSQYPLRADHAYVYPPDPTYPRVMIYDVLKALGYRVGIFSSSNENWGGAINYIRTPSVDKLVYAETWKGPTYVASQDSGFARWVANTRHAGSIDDRYTVAEAMKWMDEENKPFFVYLNFQNSHFPYTVPDDFPRAFSPKNPGFMMAFNNYPKDKAAAVRDRYDDSLRYVDAQIGKLVDHLKSHGLWDNTVLVLTGDHGQAFFEHGFAAHANMLFDELIRVPLVIHAPALEHAVDPYPAQHIDVPPSIEHLLGLPIHPAHQGLDLFAANRPEQHSIYMVVQSPLAEQFGIVRDGYELMYDKRLDAYSLYDLVHDPTQQRDLLAVEQDHARRLIERLDTWRAVQLEYYRNTLHQKAWYPPVLAD